MSEQTLQEYHPIAIEAIRAFFVQFYGAEIALSEDAEKDRVLFHVGMAKKIVAFGADFLENTDPVDIRERLAAWNIAHLSRTLERRCILNVTSDGPEEETEAAF